MKARFPESDQEKAARLARRVQQLSATRGTLESATQGIPPLETIKERVAARLQASTLALPEAVKLRAIEQAHEGYDVAQSLIRRDIAPAELTAEPLANLEAVIRVIGRPAWFTLQDIPQMEQDASKPDDDFWIAFVNAARQKLWDACGRVGCILKQVDGTRTAVGTGWMIADRTLVSNAHVALHIARQNPAAPANDPRGGWRLRPDCSAIVDFAFEHGSACSAPFPIVQVLHVESPESNGPDIAVFRIGTAENGPPPQRIELDLDGTRNNVWTEAKVFIVGHPAADLQHDDANVAAVFGSLDGTKRISPGLVLGIVGGEVITHDCSTTNGSSGSPLIDFGSMRALGLHYYGRPGERNEAVFFPAIADHPAVAKSLSGDWGI